MTPDLIKAFIKVAECQSFSTAAEELFITQSAISKRIAQLESQFDQPLFDRVGRRIRLTSAGKVILKRGKDMLKLIEQTRSEILELDGKASGKINIATSHHLGLYRLPSILKSFVHEYPNIELNMQFTDSEIAFKEISDNEVDIAIATLPEGKNNFNDIKQIQYWTDELAIVCNHNHPLYSIDSPRIEDLSKYPAILPGFQTFTRRILHTIFEKYNLDIHIAFSTNYLETIKYMVQAGLGWSALPKVMLNDELNVIDIDEFQANRALGVIINSAVSQSYAVRLFLEHLEKNH